MRLPLTVIFLLMIATPLALNIAGQDGGDAGAENRELAPFPHVDRTAASIASFAPQLAE